MAVFKKTTSNTENDKITCIIEFEILKLEISTSQDITLQPIIQKGTNEAMLLDILRVSHQSGEIQQSGVKSTISAQIAIKHNVPEPKNCKIDFLIVDQGDLLAASGEFNLANHFGSEYAECNYRLI